MHFGITHDLDFLAISLDIVKDEVISLSTDVGDTAADIGGFFEELAILFDLGIVCVDELGEGEFLVKFVGVDFGVVLGLERKDFFGSVLVIFGGVQNFFFLDFFRLVGLTSETGGFLGSFLLGDLLSF
jgi:hypothetical protein